MIKIIKEKTVEVTWKPSTKKRYIGLGYVFTDYDDTFSVSIDDLPKYSEVKITSICEQCSCEKEMTFHAYNHITKNGQKKYICRDCYLKNKKVDFDEIVDVANENGYILLTTKTEYKNGDTYLEYICPKHGLKKMRASNLYNGRRCNECRQEEARKRNAFSPEEIRSKVEALGGVLFNKEDYINQDTKNLQILCPCCKQNIFITSLKHFRQHGGQAYEECRRKESIGERRIRQWLEFKHIDFTQEKGFNDCVDKNPLPFDFYLPDYNLCIEYDGEQHFINNHFFSNDKLISGKFDCLTSYVKYHDMIKTNYCKAKGISLLRIPYTKINEIEIILDKNILI